MALEPPSKSQKQLQFIYFKTPLKMDNLSVFFIFIQINISHKYKLQLQLQTIL
jgi:hypothetical protein